MLALKDGERDPQYAADIPRSAAEALCQIGLVEREKKMRLTEAMQNTKDDKLPSILQALKAVGPVDAPTLIKHLDSKDSAVRRRAVCILKLIGKRAVPALIP